MIKATHQIDRKVSRLKILITNIRLATRTGTEIVVRDLALRLSERQHEVAIYAPTVGALAEELKDRGIAVVDDLSKLQFTPDVIHGHHGPNTGESILAFPETPAIWICHSASAWFDAPPRFSQILRIFAVDEACKTRLVKSDGIPADEIEILYNAVDFRRVRPRPLPLPSKPLRALSLVKHNGPETIIAEACRRTGLQFEACGHGVGKPIDNVEQRCAEADVVFATARTALEAMASGAAVILIDGRGFGGLITTAKYDLGRRLNFGAGMLVQQPTPAMLADAIGAYSAQDAEAVSRRVRQDADLDRMILQLEGIYTSVVQEGVRRVFDPDVLRREQIQFCRSYVGKLEPTGQWAEERSYYLSRCEHLSSAIQTLEHSRSVRLAKALHRLFGQRPKHIQN